MHRAWELAMSRTCSICTHAGRDSMDKLLLGGEQLNSVARRFSVTPDAVYRHRKHMQTVMAKAASTEQRELAYGSSLLAEVGRIRADTERPSTVRMKITPARHPPLSESFPAESLPPLGN